MKRFFIGMASGIILTTCIFGSVINNFYPRSAIVKGIQGNTVFFEDSTGHLFAWHGAEDWEIGDHAAMLMDSHGTDRINDDKIIKVMYSY